MFFKGLRSRSKSSPKSIDDNTATRTTSITLSLPRRSSSKTHTVTTLVEERTDEEESDYQEFLAKARRDEEEAERKKIKEAKKAERHQKQVDMNPWSSRM